MLRGLFHTFKRIDYFTKSDIDINEHAVELSLQVAALFGLKFSQEKINKWLKSERDFIYMATGLDSDTVSYTHLALHRSPYLTNMPKF